MFFEKIELSQLNPYFFRRAQFLPNSFSELRGLALRGGSTQKRRNFFLKKGAERSVWTMADCKVRTAAAGLQPLCLPRAPNMLHVPNVKM